MLIQMGSSFTNKASTRDVMKLKDARMEDMLHRRTRDKPPLFSGSSNARFSLHFHTAGDCSCSCCVCNIGATSGATISTLVASVKVQGKATL
ncbi:uncharacterized protein LOC113287770 isoform X2 [Papaver somniferum]|uniref:uncharacterized protein LOC113287770 isoform X2 n=1 Tax=Papaver somniferum TaxID=3469 RepID=UPI000E6F4FEF|nr:uncharacterized protein LOC113287770 isoform X2 [Papaver somniferum]